MKLDLSFGSIFRSPEFVSGLVTGEGCFYADSGYDEKYKLKFRVRLSFCIEMRYDDIVNLQEVRNHLLCGNLYYLNYGRYKSYELKGWKDHAKLRISNFVDLTEKVIPFFETYPLYGMKQKSFNIFSKIANLMKTNLHLDVDGLEKIKVLLLELKANNKKGIGTR